jgi:hypothetical protein
VFSYTCPLLLAELGVCASEFRSSYESAVNVSGELAPTFTCRNCSCTIDGIELDEIASATQQRVQQHIQEHIKQIQTYEKQ